MFKKIIAPIQAWLLSQGNCVGCGMSLSKGEREDRGDGSEKVICKCGRIFIYNKKTKKYRRALFEEV
jgi:predicted  nucleic acid-binding Zn-ribbon protein